MTKERPEKVRYTHKKKPIHQSNVRLSHRPIASPSAHHQYAVYPEFMSPIVALCQTQCLNLDRLYDRRDRHSSSNSSPQHTRSNQHSTRIPPRTRNNSRVSPSCKTVSTSTLASLLTRSVPGMFVTYQAPKNPLSFFCFCGGGACWYCPCGGP
jgi:hypothetical protein